MPPKLRIEYTGAIYHLMSRGDRREAIYKNDVDRQDFVKTLAEACQKTGWQVHAYCLMSNHFHLVVETPLANLVAGMRWLLSTYTNRLNHRHKVIGHVFSGRYKAIVVDGDGEGYLRTVCDYVHLNPVRARLLKKEERLLAYPWSSLMWYVAAPGHRPEWMRVERLLGEHGIGRDTEAGRREFEERMEGRRLEETDPEALKSLRRGWCLGGEAFKQAMLRQAAEGLREHHSGEQRLESAVAKGERIIAEELQRLGWKPEDLAARRKSDPEKVAMAMRLRRETTLTIKHIASRLSLGTPKSASTRLREWQIAHPVPPHQVRHQRSKSAATS